MLGIARATVKTHVAAVIEALDVTNRTEAATRLYELGLATESLDTPKAFRVDGFGSRPAIAVLPFDNFSSDPEQALFADGFAGIARITFSPDGSSLFVADATGILGVLTRYDLFQHLMDSGEGRRGR